MCVTPGLWTSLVYLLQCLCVWECLRDSVLKNLAKVVGPGIVPYLEPVVSFRGKKTVFVAMPMLERARLWDQKLSWYIRLANSDQQLCCEGRSSFGPSTSFSGCGLEFLFYNLTWGEKKSILLYEQQKMLHVPVADLNQRHAPTPAHHHYHHQNSCTPIIWTTLDRYKVLLPMPKPCIISSFHPRMFWTIGSVEFWWYFQTIGRTPGDVA